MKADRSGSLLRLVLLKRVGADESGQERMKAFCLTITIRLSRLIGANTCIHEQAKMTMSGSDKVGYLEYT